MTGNYSEEPDVAERPAVDRVYVQERVDDWLRRLDDLLQGIENWAAAKGWRSERGVVAMHEELMTQFNVAAQDQPSLYLHSGDGVHVLVKPKGLWVIGANGRVDIYSPKGAYTLVDIAEPFTAAKWVLHKVGQRSPVKGQLFSPDLISSMV